MYIMILTNLKPKYEPKFLLTPGERTVRLIISLLSCFVFGNTFAQEGNIGNQAAGKSTNGLECFIFRFEQDSNFTPKIAVKTNVLYWIGVMPNLKYYSFLPNLEVEWFIKPRWSLAINGAYAKWGVGNDKFFGVSSWSVEPRFWLAKYGKTEVFVGLYAQAGDFDNQNLHIDDFGNTGDFYGGGLSLGVYIPFGKQWGTELGFRTGYEHTETDIYRYESQHYLRNSTETRNRWKISSINVSVSYRFGKLKK